jgi:hypothetical protein
MPMTVPSCSGCAARRPHYVWALYPAVNRRKTLRFRSPSRLSPTPRAGNIGRGRSVRRFNRDAAIARIPEWRWGLLRDQRLVRCRRVTWWRSGHLAWANPGRVLHVKDRALFGCGLRVGCSKLRILSVRKVLSCKQFAAFVGEWTDSIRAIFRPRPGRSLCGQRGDDAVDHLPTQQHPRGDRRRRPLRSAVSVGRHRPEAGHDHVECGRECQPPHAVRHRSGGQSAQ